jgi:hypothetical protein
MVDERVHEGAFAHICPPPLEEFGIPPISLGYTDDAMIDRTELQFIVQSVHDQMQKVDYGAGIDRR